MVEDGSGRRSYSLEVSATLIGIHILDILVNEQEARPLPRQHPQTTGDEC
jgi:hypothetical protein